MRFNSVVLGLIASPAHHLLPRGLTRVAYTGPVSGRGVCLPVQSVVDGSRFLVVAGRPEQKRWWKAFRRPQPARLLRAGRRYDVLGEVLAGLDRADALTVYLAVHPGSGRAIGSNTPVIAFTRSLLEGRPQ